jgi:hypothetical protein
MLHPIIKPNRGFDDDLVEFSVYAKEHGKVRCDR